MAKSRKRKAPIFAARDEIKIQAKRDNGGISEKTKQRRIGVETTFDKAQTLNKRPCLKDLCVSRDKDGLESDLQGFFQSYFVSLDDVQDDTGNEKTVEPDDIDVKYQDDLDDEEEDEDQDEDDIDLEENDDLEEKDDQEEKDDKNDEEDCQRPKGNTAKGYKSHLKMLIKKYSDGEYDITNQVQFEKFDVSNSKLKLVG